MYATELKSVSAPTYNIKMPTQTSIDEYVPDDNTPTNVSDLSVALVFEQNLGQIIDANRKRCDNVFFKAEVNGATAFFTNEGVTFSFLCVEQSEYMQIKMGMKENP